MPLSPFLLITSHTHTWYLDFLQQTNSRCTYQLPIAHSEPKMVKLFIDWKRCISSRRRNKSSFSWATIFPDSHRSRHVFFFLAVRYNSVDSYWSICSALGILDGGGGNVHPYCRHENVKYWPANNCFCPLCVTYFLIEHHSVLCSDIGDLCWYCESGIQC